MNEQSNKTLETGHYTGLERRYPACRATSTGTRPSMSAS